MSFRCRLARDDAERAAYFALRQRIFCDEQGLFADDRDDRDDAAYPLVCLSATGEVVGVVRIWEEGPGRWWGGRLGVHPDFRAVGSVGRWLIRAAVGTARAWGATSFRATVQRPNVPLFRRLHWRELAELTVAGQPHLLMEADLDRYPLTDEIRPGAGLVAA